MSETEDVSICVVVWENCSLIRRTLARTLQAKRLERSLAMSFIRSVLVLNFNVNTRSVLHCSVRNITSNHTYGFHSRAESFLPVVRLPIANSLTLKHTYAPIFAQSHHLRYDYKIVYRARRSQETTQSLSVPLALHAYDEYSR